MKVRAIMDSVIGRRYLRAGEIADIDWPKGVDLPSTLKEVGKSTGKTKTAVDEENRTEKSVKI